MVIGRKLEGLREQKDQPGGTGKETNGVFIKGVNLPTGGKEQITPKHQRRGSES